MNTTKYALAMLGVAMAPAANAATWVGSFVDASEGIYETFDINTVPAFSGGDVASFTLTNDNLGATNLTVIEGLIFGPGTEFVETSAGSTVVAKDFFSPPPYDPSTGLVAGVYSDSLEGSVLSLGVPEPAAWALMIAGAAMAGGALRQDRQRRQAASATA